MRHARVPLPAHWARNRGKGRSNGANMDKKLKAEIAKLIDAAEALREHYGNDWNNLRVGSAIVELGLRATKLRKRLEAAEG